jgi:hypothetical protein
MQANEKYLLDQPTLAIFSNDGQRTAITIPAGTTITTMGGTVQDMRMVDVLCGEKIATMFTVDLQERATPIESAAAKRLQPTFKANKD